MRMSGGDLVIGCVLWALVGFSVGRYRGTQAARAAYVMANSAFEESERQAREVEACAHRIGELDQQIREVRLCRDQAEAERDELRAKLSRAEWRLSDDRRARRLRAQSCWCAECRAVDLADDDERAEVTS